MTPAELLQAIPGAGVHAQAFAAPLTAAMVEFDISTLARRAAFLAQIAHESGSLRYTREIADGSAYEGRVDLGNTEPGDGPRYRGRGLLQITGKANYALCGTALGLPLLQYPELLEAPESASRSAGWFWNLKNLNQYADRNMFATITKLINGGYNHLDDRLACWLTARKAMGV